MRSIIGILMSPWSQLIISLVTDPLKWFIGYSMNTNTLSCLQPVGMEPGKYEMRGSRGDCTLSVLTVEMKIDDGVWECQV